MIQPLGYVSLFSSAGVGCIGFNLEGFDCVATAELLPKRLQIQKYNQVCSTSNGYILGDLSNSEVQNKVLNTAKEWTEHHNKSQVDVVIATPPCQGMSVANHKKNNELRRNSLVVESIEIIMKLSPKYFILENVRSFLTTACSDKQGNVVSIKEAIESKLAGKYNILYRVVNLMDFGSNSSRSRTLVIGVKKDIKEITPYELFPEYKKAPSLRELISDLPKLNKMGQILDTDIYHSFRNYDTKMLEWIKGLKPGQSAFENKSPSKKPHQVINGKIVVNQEKNSDKYRRCDWDKVAPCVHTRNDILASQNTIHPEQNRVFSIRELMRFLSIPENFKWDDRSLEDLNELKLSEKVEFLKKNELNIRKCLGEAVPTAVFRSISRNIIASERKIVVKNRTAKEFIDNFNLDNNKNLISFLNKNVDNFSMASKIAELSNSKRNKEAAYYTSQDVVYTLLKDLPDFKNKKNLKILEPAVGVGNFLPVLFKKYAHIDRVQLDLIDINAENIKILKFFLRKFGIPNNFKIRICHNDYLLTKLDCKYDLIISNPPFGIMKSQVIKSYQSKGLESDINSKNLFALFFEKSLKSADTLAFITPKSLISSPEFGLLRNKIKDRNVLKLIDFGERAFEEVKIETVGILLSSGNQQKINIESNVLKISIWQEKDYIFSDKFPYWIIYRNEYFDEIISSMQLNCLKVVRDRSLTSKHFLSKGAYRVIKAKNIENNVIRYSQSDVYIDDISISPTIKTYFNKDNILIAPNLSYYPRAALLPKNHIVDGSSAVLMSVGGAHFSQNDIEFFASKEFYFFYRIARNYSVRSLNIDSASVFFWGKLKKNLKFHKFDEPQRSKRLYSIPTLETLSA